MSINHPNLIPGGQEHSSRGPSCPHCGESSSNVKDSRQHEDNKKNTYMRRRRLCNNCGERFTTYEGSAPATRLPSDLRRRLAIIRADLDIFLNAPDIGRDD